MTIEETYACIDRILPDLPGWCTPEKGRRIARLAYEKRARVCVELGVFGGRSLIALALGLKQNETGHVDGIDPYAAAPALEGTNDKANNEWWSKIDYEAILQAANVGIEQNGLGSYCKVVRSKSLMEVGRYADGEIDILHQDSNHSAEVSCAEVRAFAPKMALGGFWISDDINWPTMQSSLALLKTFGFVLVEPYPTWAIFQAVGGTLKVG